VLARSSSRTLLAAVGLLGLAVAPAVRAEGRFELPVAGQTAAGPTLEVSWTVVVRPAAADELEIVLSLDDGMSFPIRVSPPLPAGALAFHWRIPPLSADRARVAVRMGRRGSPESERVVAVSGRFAILGDPGADSGLMRGATEWWTDQALFEFGAGETSEYALTRLPSVAPRPAGESAVEDPAPDPLPGPARLHAESSPLLGIVSPTHSALSAVPHRRALIPLRL
jgi:hypothetical protein